jgi:hypothetical protein
MSEYLAVLFAGVLGTWVVWLSVSVIRYASGV